MKTFYTATTAVALALAGAAASLPADAQAQAADSVHRFDIRPGPLGAALARLGRQAGAVVTVDPALVQGKRTSGLSGSHSTTEALARILAPVGLQATPDGSGGYRIGRKATAAPARRLAPPRSLSSAANLAANR